MKGSTKLVIAAVTGVVALSATGMSALVLPNSTKVANRAATGEVTAATAPGPGDLAAAAAALRLGEPE